jgi:hypothetical protein
MIVEKQMECRLAGETQVLGENLPQRHFCPSQNPTWPDPGFNPGRRGGKPATNRQSYGAASAHALDRAAYVIAQYVPGGTEESQDKYQDSLSPSLRLEPRTFQLRKYFMPW